MKSWTKPNAIAAVLDQQVFINFVPMEIESLYNIYKGCSGGVCTDTRQIKEHCMFFALKGENFNGNEFAKQALEKGADKVIMDDLSLYEKFGGRGDNSIILVEDVLDTLQRIARHHRLSFKIPVIALTGTNGKTTTKELITATLATTYNVVSTKGNLNNYIGVPLTLLGLNEDTQIAVIEMGASAPGEIEHLSWIVCPTFGLITNVGKAHLLGFGSFDGVMKTKGELYDNLVEHKKIAFINTDNEYLCRMQSMRPSLQIVPYGVKPMDARIVREDSSPYLNVEIANPSSLEQPSRIVVRTHLIGDYNVDNVLAALCVATYFAVPTQKAIAAISNYIPSNNRSQLCRTERNTLIIDAYNANPTSMGASLDNFAKLEMENKILILGDMLELGSDSLFEHGSIIAKADSINHNAIILVGSEFIKAYKGLDRRIKSHVITFKNSDELALYLKREKPAGKTFLIKGSHGIHLEKIIQFL